jgi:hypothetical protein
MHAGLTTHAADVRLSFVQNRRMAYIQTIEGREAMLHSPRGERHGRPWATNLTACHKGYSLPDCARCSRGSAEPAQCDSRMPAQRC